MRRFPHRQRGAIFFTLTAVILAVGIGFVLLQSIQLSRERANAWYHLQQDRVDSAAESVHDWYARNAALLDATPAGLTVTDSTVLTAASVPAQWNLTAHVSNALTQGSASSNNLIQFHDIVIIAPAEGPTQTESFDPTTGLFNLCPDASKYCSPRPNTRVSGFAIEAALFKRTSDLMSDIALSAQAYFSAKFLSYPDHDVSKNWFRSPHSATPPTCDPPAAGSVDMPCVDGWLDVHADFNAAAALALIRQPDTDPTVLATCILEQGEGCQVGDAWGGTLYLANGNDANGNPFGPDYLTAEFPYPVPYRLGLKTTTPWGQDIILYAVQTL